MSRSLRSWWFMLVFLALTTSVAAGPRVLELAGPDKAALVLEDERNRDQPGPLRFAWPHDLSLQAGDGDGWDRMVDGAHRWRLEVRAPGSLSLNFGFQRFRLPWGASLRIEGQRGPVREFTAADQQDHGQLWTPVVLGDTALITLVVPAGHRDDFELELVRVGRGYRRFGVAPDEKQGTCNIDVVCPEGDDWRAEIRSVGVYTISSVWKCTGVMINNTAEDQNPFFLTADHCGVNAGNEASVVLYWNFESPECGDLSGGSLDDTQSGTVWHASFATSDMTLIELAAPPDTSWHVTYAGWERSGNTPASAVAIHHPSTDEKAISFEDDPLTTARYLDLPHHAEDAHWKVWDWDLGTTEPGSSGSPLFDPSHRIVGQLHGGYAACGNDEPDWYGRFSVSWDGGGTPETQLSHWLDPAGTGDVRIDTLDPLDDDPDPDPDPPESNLIWAVNPGRTLEVGFDLTYYSRVMIELFDLRGRSLGVIADGHYPVGEHRLSWPGFYLPSGAYFLQCRAFGQEHTVPVTIVH